MCRYSQRELLEEGFFDKIKSTGKMTAKLAGKGALSGIKTIGRIAKGAYNAAKVLDPEGMSTITAPFTKAIEAGKQFKEVFTQIPNDFRTLESRIDKQEESYGRKRVAGDIKKIKNGYIVKTRKMDNMGNPVGGTMFVLYDAKGNFKGYSNTSTSQQSNPPPAP